MIITDGKHLSSDLSLKELHVFAYNMGLKREWFQEHKKYPHYDLTTKNALKRAIDKGAKKIHGREFLKICLMKEGHKRILED